MTGELRPRLSASFWYVFASDATSGLGSSISRLALQLLLIERLHASAAEVGAIRSAQWVPYLLFGLVAGVFADRWRRRPVLIASELLAASIFATIGVLALIERLTVPILAVLVFAAGSLTCLSVAAFQSFVPRVVPDRLLPDAFSRMAQASSAIDSAGPLVAGSLVRFLGAPVAVLLDAVSYLTSAVLLGRVRVEEPRTSRGTRTSVRREVAEGARWVYRHRELRPYALWLHSWFFCFTLVSTVLVYFATVDLGLGPVTVGAILAVEGLSGLVWASFATRWGRRYGVGRVVTLVEWSSPVWAALVLLTPEGRWAVPVLVVAQVIFGAGSVSMALMMSYRTAVTPDHLRARMNATIRTFNWGGLAIAALVSGWLAATFGTRVAFAVGAAGMLAATTYLWRSPYRRVVMPDHEG